MPKGFGEDYNMGNMEGRMARTKSQKTTMQNSKQPGGGSAKGFGKGKGSKTVDGVTFDGEAGATTSAAGYNEVGSTAKRFG